MRTLKQQSNALADQASNAKFKLVDAQQEQLKLRGQIVEVTRAHTPFFIMSFVVIPCTLQVGMSSCTKQLSL